VDFFVSFFGTRNNDFWNAKNANSPAAELRKRGCREESPEDAFLNVRYKSDGGV